MIVWEVLKLAEKRLGAPEARLLYDDHSPPPPPKEESVAIRERGAGRPTKADRRAMDRLRRDDE
jgi:ribosome-associated heat shock protein Hsp15